MAWQAWGRGHGPPVSTYLSLQLCEMKPCQVQARPPSSSPSLSLRLSMFSVSLFNSYEKSCWRQAIAPHHCGKNFLNLKWFFGILSSQLVINTCLTTNTTGNQVWYFIQTRHYCLNHWIILIKVILIKTFLEPHLIVFLSAARNRAE